MVINTCQPRLPCHCFLSWMVCQPPCFLTRSLTLLGPGHGPVATSPEIQPRLRSWQGWSSCVGSPSGKAPRTRQDHGQSRSEGALQAAGKSNTSVSMAFEVHATQASQHLITGKGDPLPQDCAVCPVSGQGMMLNAATCQYNQNITKTSKKQSLDTQVPRRHMFVSHFVLSKTKVSDAIFSPVIQFETTLASRQDP